MNFFIVIIVAGQLAGAFGPGPGQAYAIPGKAECEKVLSEILKNGEPPEGAVVQCVDEKTFDALAK